ADTLRLPDWRSELAAGKRCRDSPGRAARRRNRSALPQRDVHRRLPAQPGCVAAQQRCAAGADPYPEPGPARKKIPGSALGRVLDPLADPGETGASHAARSEARAEDSLLRDRKSTRLNSSHQIISYAVFCLKKKKNK